jgi:FHS family Na+ dependent glucose MFS transporter 1
MTTPQTVPPSNPPGIAGLLSGLTRHQTLLYYLVFISLGLSAVSLGPTLAGLAQHTGSRLSEISFLFVARSLGNLLGSWQGGQLYDKLRGHRLMAVAFVSMAVMLTLAPLTSRLWALTGVLLLLGLAEGSVDVGANTLLIWVHGRRVRPFMNGLHFCYGIGAFLSPIIIAQAVLRSGDITWAYWALALLLLPAVATLLRVPSPRHDDAEQRHVQGGPVPYALVGLIALFFFLHVGAEAAYGGWVFSYATAQGLSDATVAAYLTAGYWGAITVGRLVSIPIVARHSVNAVLTGDLVGCLLSVGLLVVFPSSLLALWVATFGIGLSIASLYPMTLCLAEQHMPMSGRITGWLLIGSSCGVMVLPWLIGQAFESVGPPVTMWAIAVALGGAMAVLAIIRRRPDRPQAPVPAWASRGPGDSAP